MYVNTTLTFTPEIFGFNDPGDLPVDQFTGVRVTTLPARGTLTLDGAPMTAGSIAAVRPAQAGATWTEQRVVPGSWSQVFVSSSADGRKLAASVGGRIYTSADAGATWTPQVLTDPCNCIVSSADGSRLATTTYKGPLYTSTDSGVTWTPRLNADAGPVACSADGTRLTAFGNRFCYTSSDAGQSWLTRKIAFLVSAVAMSADGTRQVAADGSRGDGTNRLYISQDSGATWTARGDFSEWTAVASSADGLKLAAVGRGTRVFTSSDGGVTWAPRHTLGDWADVASSADGKRLVVVDRLTSGYTSSDAGLTWIARPASGRRESVASSADGSRLVAGRSDGSLATSVETTPVLQYTPAPLGSGTGNASFQFQVLDDGAAGGNIDPQPKLLTIVIDPPYLMMAPTATTFTENDPPTVIDSFLTIRDGPQRTLTSATVELGTGFDPMNEALGCPEQSGLIATYDALLGRLILSGPAGVAVYEAALRQVTYANTSKSPAESREIIFTLSDGAVIAAAHQQIQITAINDLPTATDETVAGTTGDPQSFELGFPTADLDGDPVTLIDVTASGRLSIDSFGSSKVTFSPASDFVGLAKITYTVGDGHGGMATGTLAVQITDNDAPLIGSLPAGVTLPGDRRGLAAIPDLRGEVSAADNIGVVSVRQSPVPGTALGIGDHTVEFQVADAAGNVVSGFVTVTVSAGPENHAPVLTSVPPTLSVTEDQALFFNANASDADGDAVVFRATGAAKGTVMASGARLVYTPLTGATGEDRFTLLAEDGYGGVASAEVQVTITPLPPALAGRYALLLSDETGPRAALTLQLTAAHRLTGVLRREDNASFVVRLRSWQNDGTGVATLADGSTLVLNFDGKGHVSATAGVLSGTGRIAPEAAPAGLSGTYTMALDPGTGGIGWCLATLSGRGNLRVIGLLPDGSVIRPNPGMILDRDSTAPLFFIGDHRSRTLVAGIARFSTTARPDVQGTLIYKTGGHSAACELTGSKFSRGAAAISVASHVIDFEGAGVEISAMARVEKGNLILAGAPVLSLVSGAGPGQSPSGVFRVRFRLPASPGRPAGQVCAGSGVFLQNLGQAAGLFRKGGATGSVRIEMAANPLE